MGTKGALTLSLFVFTICFSDKPSLSLLIERSTGGMPLNFRNNSLTEIFINNTFYQGVTIGKIDFSWNSIQKVTLFNYTFLARTLTDLNLSHNQISNISDSAFSLLTNLTNLDLSYNLVSGEMLYEGEVFEDLTALKELHLEGNPLQYLKTNTFSYIQLRALMSLNLSHCGISKMEENSVELPSLLYLDLSWNLLEGINRDSFKMMVYLRVLDINHNNIKVLSEIPFLPEIETMYFDNNGMETLSIKDEIWQNADSLQKLYLRNNNIEKFTVDSLPLDLKTLKELDMGNNSLLCNCQMKWINMQKYNFEDRNISLPCRYPIKLQGRNLLTVPLDELSCPIPTIRIGVLLSIVICAVVFVVFAAYVSISRRKQKRRKAFNDDTGGDYIIVYTQNNDVEEKIEISDGKALLKNDRELDV